MAASNSTQASHSDGAFSAYGTARSTIEGKPLSMDELFKIDAYWRASLYLCIVMLYLKANALLREPLSLEHTKPRLLSHWSSDPVQCFTYVHFNRLTNKYDLNALYLSGPGRGAPAVPSHRPGPRCRGQRRFVRARTRIPRLRGTMDRASAGRRTAFPARYGHFVRSVPLLRTSRYQGLERTPADHRMSRDE